MNKYCALWAALTLLSVSTGLQAASPPSASTAVTEALTQARPQSGGKSATTELGKIRVRGMKELIQSLQVVKVALKQPFSSDSAQANTVVCRIIQGHGHLHVEERMGAMLECGTNSWFMWHKDACINAGLAQCASGQRGSAFKRQGAWHSMRPLNLRQVMYMRQLLNELPPPGKGDVIVVDAKGKPMLTVKATEQSDTDGPH